MQRADGEPCTPLYFGEEFGVSTDEDISSLLGHAVRVDVFLHPDERTQERLVLLPPSARRRAVAAWFETTFARISAALSLRDIKRSRRGGLPSTSFECELDGGQLPLLLCEVGVNSVHLLGVEGRARQPRELEEQLEWYAVLARFAIQVEDQTSGMQRYEDRIVLVRATDFEDAERRLESEFAAYGQPYFNPEWELVRWHFERVLDVYEPYIETLDPAGTEVYSTLRTRRMRPEYEWHPRDELDETARD